jgi:hypothetical protein
VGPRAILDAVVKRKISGKGKWTRDLEHGMILHKYGGNIAEFMWLRIGTSGGFL